MRIAFVDLETSGLDPLEHEVIEVAIIVENDGLHREFECSLPFDVGRANPKALEINGWGRRPFPPKMDPADAVAAINDLTRGAHFVGNCPWFDDGFLKALFRAHGVAPGWHYHLVDVENMIAGLLGFAPPWDSERVSRAVGIVPPVDQHGAMPDARWARDLYHAVLSVHDREGMIRRAAEGIDDLLTMLGVDPDERQVEDVHGSYTAMGDDVKTVLARAAIHAAFSGERS